MALATAPKYRELKIMNNHGRYPEKMHVLIIAGILALAGAQTTVDPSVLIDIFGKPPTPTTRQPLEEVKPVDQKTLDAIFGPDTPNRIGTTQSIDEVPRSTRLVKVDGLPTIKPSLLTEVFGTPPTTSKSSRQTHENSSATGSNQGSRDVKVQGVPTIKPSLLTEVFGTPPAPDSSRQRYEDKKSTGATQGTRVVGVATVKPSLLTEVFGTPPTPDSSRQRYEDKKSTGATQGTRVVGVPTVKPLLLTEVFGTPPTPDSSRQGYEDKKSTGATQRTRVVGVPTLKPSLLTEVFGTPPTPDSSRQGYEDKKSTGATQGTRVVGVPTVKPSLLTEVFGTPPTPDSSRQGYEDKNSMGVAQGTRNVNVEGIPAVDTSVLIDIFGTPPTTNSSKNRFEDITVKPTEEPSTFVDKEGQKCQCVPYYLCDSNNVGVDVNNASVTGYGTLDIRFGEDDNEIERKCQESVEVCCVIPKDPTEVPKPLPKPEPVKGCGYRNPNGLGITITGGTGAESQFGEFPWVVALLDSRNSSYAGVGVLIHPQVVMTGAHIAAKYGPGELKIRAGEWDTQTVKEIYPFEERSVQTTIIHENFQPKSLKNDMALLLLDSPVEISQHINVICLPEQEEVFDSSKNCVANGWGKSNFGQSNRYAVILKKVEVDMVPYNRCNNLLKRTRLGHNFKLHNSFVCAGGEAGKDTCQGDGGAPLACPIGNNRYKLTGLVAWGIGCGQQDVPAVYTNVPLFRDWVDDKMTDWGLGATSYRVTE